MHQRRPEFAAQPRAQIGARGQEPALLESQGIARVERLAPGDLRVELRDVTQAPGHGEARCDPEAPPPIGQGLALVKDAVQFCPARIH